MPKRGKKKCLWYELTTPFSNEKLNKIGIFGRAVMRKYIKYVFFYNEHLGNLKFFRNEIILNHNNHAFFKHTQLPAKLNESN